MSSDKQLINSKKSISTNACSDKKIESIEEFEELNGLDYTFNEIKVKSLPSNKKETYAHTCPYSVIIYGLLYNHLHLQGNSDSLPQIKKLSQRIIDIFKETFLDLEDEINDRYP